MTSVTMMLGDAESRSVLGATCSSEEGEGWELGQELEGRAAGTVNIITSSSCATTAADAGLEGRDEERADVAGDDCDDAWYD
eukprot:CAMPEP_0178500754 /NCGR_PEP_ID=MMETSP0696-20121128/16572_1 /TAXON_ID=265572 /ORGANISM="Extubocellulus spinifer, Strain CCMP396" /LENGTH=81 /DNA_ID=CAMNT_0020129631 /DNA_START=20 /DNA_END=264 /DNA_ORIENTATION=+